MARRRPTGTWTDFAVDLGVSLQRLRIERGLSQEQLAYAAGLSRYTYQKFERGQSMPGAPANPSLRNVMALAAHRTFGGGWGSSPPATRSIRSSRAWTWPSSSRVRSTSAVSIVGPFAAILCRVWCHTCPSTPSVATPSSRDSSPAS